MRSLTTLAFTSLSLTHLAASSEAPPAPEQCGPGTPLSPLDYNTLSLCVDSNIPISTPRAWFPWTHRPHCIPADEEPWCVFTNAAAPKGHGISVITTPDQAASLLHPLAHRVDTPFFAPSKLYHSPPYEVRDVPGKGKGAVATRRLEKGRVVLVDHASVIAAVEYPADVMREEVQELLRVAVERLSEPQKVAGLARLARRDGERAEKAEKAEKDEEDAEEEEEEEEEGEERAASEIEEVMLTNTFAVGIEGKEYMALFADLARFNHACKPNAFIHFSETTLAMTVWTAEDIEPGEEITITYSAAGMPSKERREILERIWGFKCQCSLCTASPEALNASDARRTQIPLLQEEVVKLAQKGEFEKALEEAETLFKIVEEEGLTDQMGGMYEVPARLYYHVGNLEKALEYTLKVKHEIDGFGVPGKFGAEKLKMLKGVIERIERELEEKRRKEASSN
ncbi:hypothetical protein MFIFM68171_08224 [Madurella fahalii]|uniref:SET domain-containing protein n=1 Tax=Madurella fahalii TaxID=1157608 RepID=A0ABQ0GJZ1_9PEZI